MSIQQRPLRRQIVAAQVVAADLATSAEFAVPNDADSVKLIVQATNTAGASPTLVTALQDSPDGGTTWVWTGNSTLHSATGIRVLSFMRDRHAAQAAAVVAGDAPAVGAAEVATNVLVARQARLLFRLGGTGGPSWTVNVWIETGDEDND